MKIAIILSLFIRVALFDHKSTFNFNNGLIHKGKTFKSEDYPYVMYLRMWYENRKNGYRTCTASLVKELFILTSGWCCDGYTVNDLEVCQGSPIKVKSIDFHRVSKIHLHENYSIGSNDICVLKLDKKFPKIKKFLKIGGSSKDFAYGKKLNCRIFGFGRIGDEKTVLGLGYMMTNDIAYGSEACQPYKGNEEFMKNNWKQHLCLVPQKTINDSTICLGDGGGPMICNETQYGINSFMYNFIRVNETDSKCGTLEHQIVFIFLKAHRKWLNNIIEPKKKKRNSGNTLKPRHYTLYIILTILLCNMLTFI